MCAWLTLAFAGTRRIKTPSIKAALFCFTLGLGCATSFTCWHRIITSESITSSILVLGIGVLLFFSDQAKAKKIRSPLRWALGFGVLILLFSFGRDDNPFLVVFLGVVLAAYGALFTGQTRA